MRRLMISVPLATLATLWLTSAALAGGWAVTTLDAVPQYMQAGQTYQIGYMMRQHGVTPIRDGTPRIVLTNPAKATEVLSFPGRAEGAPGHYVSEVTFPRDGEWLWSVDQSPFPMPQTLGAITIGTTPVVAAQSIAAAGPNVAAAPIVAAAPESAPALASVASAVVATAPAAATASVSMPAPASASAVDLVSPSAPAPAPGPELSAVSPPAPVSERVAVSSPASASALVATSAPPAPASAGIAPALERPATAAARVATAPTLKTQPPAELALFGLVALALVGIGVALLQVKRAPTPVASRL